ncbi:MAG: hypothetical protein ACR2Q4_20560 [Geminicoccaceae bacterium]
MTWHDLVRVALLDDRAAFNHPDTDLCPTHLRAVAVIVAKP